MFVVIEGVDKSGKTTLVNELKRILPSVFSDVNVTFLKYPNRDGPIGSIIHGFLTGMVEMNDETVQLLFTADRWHTRSELEKALMNGGIVVCDRYIHSGLAYAAARGVNVAWCAEMNNGLPAPDLIVYISVDEQTQKSRGIGEETFETSIIQKRVREQYTSLIDNENAFGHSTVLYVDGSASKECVVNCALLAISDAYGKDMPIVPFRGY